MIFLVYVDNSLFFAPAAAANIDKPIKDVKEQGYNISDEGEIDDYLGVKIKKKRQQSHFDIATSHQSNP